MKIRDLEVKVLHVNQRGNWVLLFVHTDSGLTGFGEASQTGNDAFMVEYLRQITPRIKGLDPRDIIHVCNIINPLGPFRQRFTQAAASAVEMALWDICGKAAGLPVYRMLGGAVHPSLRLYANINRGLIEKTPQEYSRMAQRAVDSGFNAVKCDPFEGVHRFELGKETSGGDIQLGLERLSAIRSTIGDDVELMVDAHTRFNYPMAKMLCASLESFNLFWLEDPLEIEHTEATAELRSTFSMPMAGGEVMWNRHGFRKLLDTDCLDVLMPDVKYCGGIKELQWISNLADDYGVLISPHGPSGPVSVAAAVQAMLGTQNFLILEYAFGEVDWREELTMGSERIIDGHIPAPEKPGLGIELDRKMIEKHCKP